MACSASDMGSSTGRRVTSDTASRSGEVAKFEQDRQAILAMAGTYRVKFDFTETVPFVAGYKLKDHYEAGAHEVVRVIEDRGYFISLQHILVVGDKEKFPVKHWRQDWAYEPDSVLVYIGGNAWERRDLSAQESRGKWSQTVYQVDDSPRYGAVAAWNHENGVSEWEPAATWRPLPRRDATKRDDYQVVDAVNRHAITPTGWVHEQDNTKLVLRGKPQSLVREIGVNSYVRDDTFDAGIADRYWAETKDYWALVRQAWSDMERQHRTFGLTIQGEPEALYQELLGLAESVRNGEKTVAAAGAEARDVIARFTTVDVGDLMSRISTKVTESHY
ncbi:MAG: hypothetical protein D6763_08795 [Alphaproteobacteria bacterium]|nr:MAG: hypothetical protein D6763_08795 [Alphaproteobacteria bacterium]